MLAAMMEGARRQRISVRDLARHSLSAREVQVHRLDLALATAMIGKDARAPAEPLEKAASVLLRRSAGITVARAKIDLHGRS
jgi:hypothetical protein